ncbi:GNAT family N-acetyltransferase [Clostridium culturomicium]|uniref:GNAT family N-acetyltransferase n=1 Tax=Clostridium culturomicium TaxID=1499683 RepID=UPI000AD41773|nr:GNAT family N-acetyltransferase [Clostridium culturomicium]
MNVTFKDIDNENLDKVNALKIKRNQEGFIESVDECLKEASICKEWHPVAIYNHDKVIGFAMYGSFGPNRHTWIDRILIDEKHQNKGFGKAAMKKLIKVVSQTYNVDTLYLSIVEENKVAYKLYTSIGFKDMNEKDPSNDELMFKYEIKDMDLNI